MSIRDRLREARRRNQLDRRSAARVRETIVSEPGSLEVELLADGAPAEGVPRKLARFTVGEGFSFVNADTLVFQRSGSGSVTVDAIVVREPLDGSVISSGDLCGPIRIGPNDCIVFGAGRMQITLDAIPPCDDSSVVVGEFERIMRAEFGEGL